VSKPKVNNAGEEELKKMGEKFDSFQEEVKSLSYNNGLSIPVKEQEQQTKMSNREILRAPEIFLKPKKSIGSPQRFNESFRSMWNFQKEFVRFIAENIEAKGEPISDIWTRPFGGVDAELWDVPVNKPVWGPRYLAEQIKRKSYTRLKMDADADARNYVNSDSNAQYYGRVVHDTRVQRLDAMPAPETVTVSGFQSNFKS